MTASAGRLAGLEQKLAEVAAEARRTWPTLALPDELFFAHLATRLQDVDPRTGLDQLSTSDLYLACACLNRVPAAPMLLERHFLSALTPQVARVDRSPDFIDEVKQRLRERLLVGARPRIADYTGRGPLGGWLRVAAVRTALLLRRETARAQRSFVPTASAADPEREAIRGEYRETIARALRLALRALDAQTRERIRLHYVERLTFESLGARWGVDRSSASRRVLAARQTLLAETRRALATLAPRLTPASRDSLMVTLSSQIHLTLERALATERP